MTFYLFRHAQTFFSKNHIPYGIAIESAEILPEGIAQIHKIDARLIADGVKTVYCSPIKRCVQTIEIVKKDIPNLRVIFNQGLEEGNVSNNSEDPEDIIKRVGEFLKTIRASKLKKVAVCTHGVILAVLVALLDKGFAVETDLNTYPPCGELIIIEDKK